MVQSFLDVAIEHVSIGDLDLLERGELDEYVQVARITYDNGWFIRVPTEEWDSSDRAKLLIASSVREVLGFAQRNFSGCSWVCLSAEGFLFTEAGLAAYAITEYLPVYDHSDKGVPL